MKIKKNNNIKHNTKCPAVTKLHLRQFLIISLLTDWLTAHIDAIALLNFIIIDFWCSGLRRSGTDQQHSLSAWQGKAIMRYILYVCMCALCLRALRWFRGVSTCSWPYANTMNVQVTHLSHNVHCKQHIQQFAHEYRNEYTNICWNRQVRRSKERTYEIVTTIARCSCSCIFIYYPYSESVRITRAVNSHITTSSSLIMLWPKKWVILCASFLTRE